MSKQCGECFYGYHKRCIRDLSWFRRLITGWGMKCDCLCLGKESVYRDD